jgi:RNA polymerase sigma-70 factor (ECF subfamily)
MTAELDFESLVVQYYPSLYQFAFSLTQAEHDACDLTQQTFYIWAARGHQLRDATKVKTWLFTTLYREFLQKRRKQTRFPHHELSEVDFELPSIAPEMINHIDQAAVVRSLREMNEAFQAPLALFYLQDYSYKEIAEILEIPIGTVKSRISRGIALLQQILLKDAISAGQAKEVQHG